MELKRILARDTRSATEKAMALYGPDVLIISNQRVEGQTELIVALEVTEASSEELMQEELAIGSVRPTTSAQRISSTPSSVNNPFKDHLHHLLKPGAQTGVKQDTQKDTETAAKLSAVNVEKSPTEQLLTQDHRLPIERKAEA